MSCVSLDVSDSIRKLKRLLQNKLFICICSVSIVFNLYLYILDTPWTSCKNPGSDSDLCSPPETCPRGLPPRPGVGEARRQQRRSQAQGRGSRPGPLLQGAGPSPGRSGSLGPVPIPPTDGRGHRVLAKWDPDRNEMNVVAGPEPWRETVPSRRLKALPLGRGDCQSLRGSCSWLCLGKGSSILKISSFSHFCEVK